MLPLVLAEEVSLVQAGRHRYQEEDGFRDTFSESRAPRLSDNLPKLAGLRAPKGLTYRDSRGRRQRGDAMTTDSCSWHERAAKRTASDNA